MALPGKACHPVGVMACHLLGWPLAVGLHGAAALAGMGLLGSRRCTERRPGAHRGISSAWNEVWERTDKPFDTKWYGNMSGYNYYCIFDYCGRYYDVSRLTKPVDDAALQACDVLILKIPTRLLCSRRNRCHRPLRRIAAAG